MTTQPLARLRTAQLALTPEGQPLDGRAKRIPRVVLDVASSQLGLVSRRQLLECGVPPGRIARHVGAGRWAEIVDGVYLVLPEAVEDRDWRATTEQRAQIAVLWSGPHVVPSAFAALTLAGIDGAPLDFVPEVACRPPARLRSRPGLRVRRVRTDRESPRHPGLLRLWEDLTVVAPAFAIAQVARLCDRDTLVSILDSALHVGRIGTGDLDRIATLVLAGRPGARVFREARALVDHRAESPFETRARLQCRDHGVPPDDLQRRVRDQTGRVVARCDLVWELGGGRLLVVELDGEHHRRDAGIERDNARDRALVALGHRVLHFAWEDLATGVIWRLVLTILAEEGRLIAPAVA
ncbi:uncharacterized protein DUF559 [Salana multivorans]|uniref:Uncharacterized protein DUF559 n=1 Tax=Salana multivorans TaxID=120377 RepID=A0A3N2DC61_9MICO|nr:type IV toxin-antitoxin system AbiEi family antitoxin domain-containing protein [Salana multivorans]ROR97343.1 uncharacterized protein DUF559 [Salana multivorans]